MNTSLTPRQTAFCGFIVEGDDQTEAYRKAYKCPDASIKSITERASRLMRNSNISAMIAGLRVPVVERLQMSLESHLTELASLRDAARAKEQFSAAISAEVSRGKAAGFYVERSEVEDKSGPRVLNVIFSNE